MNRIDYLNALRHAQEMPVAPPPVPGNGPKFNLNGKLLMIVQHELQGIGD